MPDSYLPRMSDRLMNESLLSGRGGSEFGVRTLLPQTPESGRALMAEMLTPDRGMSASDRFMWGSTPAGGMELAANIIGGPALRGIRAFHGSPHKFDKFSMDRIGTGEGAQSYGHGLYFAENEAVAKSYRDKLNQYNPAAIAKDFLSHYETPQQAAEALRRDIAALGWRGSSPERVNAQTTALKLLESGEPVTGGGHMYEVNIRANPEQFLDLDKNPQLRDLVRTREGSEQLRAEGVPGVKYLDQGSRSQGAGTNNYVVFDDSIIDILKRYGIVGGLSPLVAASQGDMGYQPQRQAPLSEMTATAAFQ